MIVLTPSETAQEFNIIPRNKSSLANLTLVITDESTKQSQTITDVTAEENGNYIKITEAFSILKENRLYKISITQSGVNWWRGKAICTSQTNHQLKHSLNTITSNQYIVLEQDDSFTILQ